MRKKITIPETKIPTRSIWSLIISLVIVGFAYIQAIGYIIPGFEEISKLDEKTTIEDIGLMWIPVISYAIIGSFIFMVIRIFKELKPHKKMGLVVGFKWGLIASLIAGLVWSLVWSLVWGLVGGLIIGLIAGLTVGLIVGLTEEFKWFTSLDYQAFFITKLKKN